MNCNTYLEFYGKRNNHSNFMTQEINQMSNKMIIPYNIKTISFEIYTAEEIMEMDKEKKKYIIIKK